MGSHDRKSGFSRNVAFSKNVKCTVIVVSNPVGDRLTTGMSSAEPVHGRTLFGVSTKGLLTIMTEHKAKNIKLSPCPKFAEKG
tara:strand:+ start:23380 stop:23628 length:249 start_codon:yes stop_codon:yes gene_type:complete